jgi:hypothetical protein
MKLCVKGVVLIISSAYGIKKELKLNLKDAELEQP